VKKVLQPLKETIKKNRGNERVRETILAMEKQ
jgi:hypothetical protein